MIVSARQRKSTALKTYPVIIALSLVHLIMGYDIHTVPILLRWVPVLNFVALVRTTSLHRTYVDPQSVQSFLQRISAFFIVIAVLTVCLEFISAPSSQFAALVSYVLARCRWPKQTFGSPRANGLRQTLAHGHHSNNLPQTDPST